MICARAMELFGFGLGTFSELTEGVARAPGEAIPWLLDTDCDMMVYVERRATGEVSKDLKSLAEICHKLTSERGLGELSVTDHKLTPMVGQDSNPRPFRYDVKRNPKINAFTPKQLQTQEGEHMACRATQFGAIDFTDHTKVELTSGGNELRPSKPKFWLTCRVDLPGESAVRLS
ncbi:unnamed protein product [Symbiodinium necroappetens]|uniref:Uncharacterized protein n=1 Tax=Symbiodinium necroappetens TaxID=1628268 RepID=A0A812UQG4_9DINO|nr:unnamed protein product [Symbiodinium necroappetens]